MNQCIFAAPASEKPMRHGGSLPTAQIVQSFLRQALDNPSAASGEVWSRIWYTGRFLLATGCQDLP